MSRLNLEISDKEFVIKLDRSTYTIGMIENVIKRIQYDYAPFTLIDHETDGDVRSRTADHFVDSFDHLSEK
ncbi:hypothetical protein [Albibacterium indicum]|uniref:hypothetical protein n=1 Tax=Albibacterium indicum TaxID=2292082 RepID=UPI001300387B|nr:hypothetical protein [Pedobacter indicus]